MRSRWARGLFTTITTVVPVLSVILGVLMLVPSLLGYQR